MRDAFLVDLEVSLEPAPCLPLPHSPDLAALHASLVAARHRRGSQPEVAVALKPAPSPTDTLFLRRRSDFDTLALGSSGACPSAVGGRSLGRVAMLSSLAGLSTEAASILSGDLCCTSRRATAASQSAAQLPHMAASGGAGSSASTALPGLPARRFSCARPHHAEPSCYPSIRESAATSTDPPAPAHCGASKPPANSLFVAPSQRWAARECERFARANSVPLSTFRALGYSNGADGPAAGTSIGAPGKPRGTRLRGYEHPPSLQQQAQVPLLPPRRQSSSAGSSPTAGQCGPRLLQQRVLARTGPDDAGGGDAPAAATAPQRRISLAWLLGKGDGGAVYSDDSDDRSSSCSSSGDCGVESEGPKHARLHSWVTGRGLTVRLPVAEAPGSSPLLLLHARPRANSGTSPSGCSTGASAGLTVCKSISTCQASGPR